MVVASIFAESLKRLYGKQKVTKSKLDELLAETKLTQAEYDYILEVENEQVTVTE